MPSRSAAPLNRRTRQLQLSRTDLMCTTSTSVSRVLRAGGGNTLAQGTAGVKVEFLAGMRWTKQFFYYDVDKWLKERGADRFDPA
jgi:hypothetical protein